jgi:hypothetical protein
MAAHVIFFSPRGIGSIDAPGVGDVRLREAVTVPGVTTGTAKAGEVVVIANEGGATILVAHGKAPDAAATTSTSNTTAGFPVLKESFSPPFLPAVGSKIDIKALA